MYWPTALKTRKVPPLRLRKLPTLALSSAILFLLSVCQIYLCPTFRQEDKIIFFGYHEPCVTLAALANQSTCDTTAL